MKRYRTKHYLGLTALLVVSMVFAAAAYVQSRSRTSSAPADTADRGNLAVAKSYAQAQSSDLPSSAERVHIRARFAGKAARDGSRELAVQLAIAPGWHVNANPASLEGLIPTALRATAAGQPVSLTVHYPSGRTSDIRLEGKSLKVYDDGTVIRARVPAPALAAARTNGGLVLTTTVQSCSNKVCLPPAQLITHLQSTQ
jgi:hypothetical protein